MKKRSILIICRAAIIATMYFILSVALPMISFGTIQFRLSEALTLLPILMPEAIVGLTIGCFFTNIFFSPFGILDMAIGTATTFVAAILTYLSRKKPALAALPPIILNALFIPLIWIIQKLDSLYYINMFSILISQSIVIYAIGLPFTLGLRKILPNTLYNRKNKNKKKTEPKNKTNDNETLKNKENKINKNIEKQNNNEIIKTQNNAPQNSNDNIKKQENNTQNDNKNIENCKKDDIEKINLF